ncbi:MAG TPA: VapC toxin family PIN domain ribonuclease [Firmicutes bacterium]|jgi:tRNA(fMet)-specific endonuclease VapC|nr:VapC toxin family PIN domain ribonuclease [Bacillota bacterium]
MNGNIVDTNVIIKMLNGDSEAIQIFDSLDHIHISVITAGELFYGANKSSQREENLELFKDFLREYPMIGIDEKTSQIYGELKAGLVKTGMNIPENDLWIAATAFQHDLTVVSFDSHFKNLKL